MAADIRRSRSHTSTSTRSNRPPSRASTTSIHSFEQFQQQPQPRAAHSHYSQPPAYNAPFTSEPLQPVLLQAAQHVSAQDNLMSMSLESVQQYLGSYESTPQPALPPAPMDGHAYHPSMSMGMPQPQPQSQPQHYLAPVADADEKKKKGSASGSATNDKELRQLLAQNEGRELKDVAAEVIQNDRTSKAEKSKQLFAMLWWVCVMYGVKQH
jgi:regulatory factor X